MPGVSSGPDSQLAIMLAQLQQRVRALEAQQQIGVTNPQGQQVLTLGLVPGSSPAAYGLQFLDPTSGQQIAFLGENNGSTTLSLTLTTGGTIEVDNGGTIVLKSTTGKKVFLAGTIPIPDGSGRTQQAVQMFRDDGTAALELVDGGTVLNHPHQQALGIYDRGGNTLLADDTTSGVGLARPHLPLGTMSNTNTSTWFSTSATTWTSIAEIFVEYQNAKLSWQFELYAPANTNGSFRLLLNGTQIASTTVTGGTGGTFSTWYNAGTAWPSGTSWGTAYKLQLEAEVTSGTGTLYAEQQFLSGVQS